MARYRWDDDKNALLQRTRGISFEEIVAAIETGGLLDNLQHHNPARYPRQRLFVIALNNYVYQVP